MRVDFTRCLCDSPVDSQLIRYAREAAQTMLAEDAADAWQRSEAAAEHAVRAVTILERPRGEMMVAAAWLHAIGESPAVKKTNFAPVDGAVQLLSDGWPAPVVSLVAHQAQARLVAPAYDAAQETALFERIQGWPSDILDYAIVLGLDGTRTLDPEACVRLASQQLPASLRISARDRSERERRLRRAIDRVNAAMISARTSTPVST